MNLIYIHGLNSDANSTKGQLLEQYCQRHHPEITVLRPDLNKSPEKVREQLLALISGLNDTGNKHNPQSSTVLIGSSLGGYFSTLISNETGCPALLLNPSTQPHITLQRFADTSQLNQKMDFSNDTVLHTTAGGWQMTVADVQWFADHQLSTLNHPHKVAALIKAGDELLDAELSAAFYQEQGASVVVQAGGDHRFSDFSEHLPQVMILVQQLAQV